MSSIAETPADSGIDENGRLAFCKSATPAGTCLATIDRCDVHQELLITLFYPKGTELCNSNSEQNAICRKSGPTPVAASEGVTFLAAQEKIPVGLADPRGLSLFDRTTKARV